MTKNIFKRISAIVIALIMCFGMVAMTPMVAHAANYEDDGTWISDYDTMLNRGQDDRKVVFEVICPEALRSTVRVLVENNTTGQRYFARCEAVNQYKCNIWLPIGDYTVLDVWVPAHEKFEFIIDVVGFSVEASNNGTITYTMKDLDKWVADEYGNLTYDENAGNNNQGGNENPGTDNPGIDNPGNNENPGNNNQGNNNQGNQNGQGTTDKELTREEFIAEINEGLFDTAFDFIKIDSKATLYYNTYYEGYSKAYMRVSGFSKEAYNGVIQITKSGILGEATFKVSIDGGKTFLSETYVASSSTSLSDLGLTVSFYVPKDTDELLVGDVYTFKTIVTHSLSTNAAPDKAVIVATGDATHSFKYKVEVMSSGGFGVAKVAIYDGKLSEPQPQDKTVYVIPENGVLKLDNGAELVFKDMDTYTKGQEFIVNITVPEVETIDYTNLYILCGIVGFAGIILFTILLNKKEKKTDYTINEYKGHQDESKYK